MKLDRDTLAALGYGDPWQQQSLAFGVYLVARNARTSGMTPTQKRAADERHRRKLGMAERVTYASAEERQAAHRARCRANMATPEARERDKLRKRAARAKGAA